MYLLTMQSQTTYETKTKTVQTAEEMESWVTKAKKVAAAVVYEDKHDGTDHGLVRSLCLLDGGRENEYVLTVHKQ